MLLCRRRACVRYLKCVRCLWMSRSRMGVGLEEPRGERSWLSKSWNSLQICLMDRRREGRRVYHLSPTQPSQLALFWVFSPPCTHPGHFGSTRTLNPSQETHMLERDNFNVNPKMSETPNFCKRNLGFFSQWSSLSFWI